LFFCDEFDKKLYFLLYGSHSLVLQYEKQPGMFIINTDVNYGFSSKGSPFFIFYKAEY